MRVLVACNCFGTLIVGEYDLKYTLEYLRGILTYFPIGGRKEKEITLAETIKEKRRQSEHALQSIYVYTKNLIYNLDEPAYFHTFWLVNRCGPQRMLVL